MKKFLHSRDGASKGARSSLFSPLLCLLLSCPLRISHVLRRTGSWPNRAYNDTSADLLARSALDITVSDLKQEIANNSPVTAANIQPLSYGAPPINDPTPIPNLIRRSSQGPRRPDFECQFGPCLGERALRLRLLVGTAIT